MVADVGRSNIGNLAGAAARVRTFVRELRRERRRCQLRRGQGVLQDGVELIQGHPPITQCESYWGEAALYTRPQCTANSCASSGSSASCSACRVNSISCEEGSPSFSTCTSTGTYGPQQQCPKDGAGV